MLRDPWVICFVGLSWPLETARFFSAKSRQNLLEVLRHQSESRSLAWDCLARAHACMHARWVARAHAQTHLRTHPRTHPRTHTRTYAPTHSRTYARSLARSHAGTRTRKKGLAHAFARTLCAPARLHAPARTPAPLPARLCAAGVLALLLGHLPACSPAGACGCLQSWKLSRTDRESLGMCTRMGSCTRTRAQHVLSSLAQNAFGELPQPKDSTVTGELG